MYAIQLVSKINSHYKNQRKEATLKLPKRILTINRLGYKNRLFTNPWTKEGTMTLREIIRSIKETARGLAVNIYGIDIKEFEKRHVLSMMNKFDQGLKEVMNYSVTSYQEISTRAHEFIDSNWQRVKIPTTRHFTTSVNNLLAYLHWVGLGKRGPALISMMRMSANEVNAFHSDIERLRVIMERWNKGSQEITRKDRKSTRLNSSHSGESRMPSSA